MPTFDPIFAQEARHHIRESQNKGRVRKYQAYLEEFRAYTRAPENREKVNDIVRGLIALADQTGRQIGRQVFSDDDLQVMCARDSQLRAFMTGQRDLGPAAVHVNQLMTELSVRFANSGMIGEELAPPISVAKESNYYAYYDERDSLAFPDNFIGPRGDVPEIEQDIDTTNASNLYRCEGRGFKRLVSPREIANADVPIDPLLEAQLLVMEGNAWRREKKSAEFFTTSGNYASSNVTAVTAGEEWDSAGGGNPVKQIQDAVKGVFRTRGATRRIGACSIDVYMVLSRHPAILDVNKYQRVGFVPRESLAAFFNLDELYVAEAWEDTANPGATAAYSRIWGDYFVVLVQQPGASPYSYQFCSRFRKGGVQNETLFVPHEGMSGMYHVKETYLEDLKGVAPRAGWLLSGCLA